MASTRAKRGEVPRVLNAFRTLVKSLRVADRAAIKRHGLGSAQIFVLHQLNVRSPLSVTELAELTATDQSTVSVVINKLLERGFVTRERAASDARRAVVALTAKGRQIVRKTAPPFQETLIAGILKLPAKRASALADGLEELLRALDIEEKNPPMLFED
jgi:DNA-binding MarR family transcriptional regulator